MCGGNKGQSQQTQTQSYSPDPRAAGYITNALDRASQTANLGFNVPVAPVAGFSRDQQTAFGNVNNAQGMAQPYFNQAANYYNQGATGSNISNFFNPFAGAVTANLNDVFGAQRSQNNGNLVQSAGGVGADRIGVGQAELAKQQGLVAGQTLASLYQPALQASQNAAFGAGQGLMNVGQGSQNAALQGAQAQLGTGGLQQQLQQAQMNAPYQWQVAQAAFPYQQSQFLSGAVGALAPGLGGTTNGQTTSTPPQPSIWSQLLGGGAALAGGLGQTGAFGSNGWLTGSNSPQTGATYGGYGGGSNGWGSMGGIQYPAYAEGGGVSDDPIDIAANPFIPQSQLVPIKPNIPQLQQPQQGGSGGSGKGGGIGDIVKLATLFINRGGRVNPFAAGGAVDDPFGDENRRAGYDLLRQGMGGEGAVSAVEEPYRLAGPEAMDAWRRNTPVNPSAMAGDVPLPAARPDASPQAAPAMAYAPETPAQAGAPAPAPALPPEINRGRSDSFIDSPWAALTAAGLGIMGGTSPFAGVNIGQGGMQGLKMLQQQRENSQKDETLAQSVARLQQEAQHHQDQYNKMTPYQRESLDLRKQEVESESKNATYLGPSADGAGSVFLDKKTGQTRVEPIRIAGKEKPLPSGLQKDLGEKATMFNQLSSLENQFKPDFAGHGFEALGDAKNFAARQFGIGTETDKAAADWWQGYQAFKSDIRHGKYGAALTKYEIGEWAKQDVNPGMKPERIQANMKRQREIIEGAVRRRASSLAKQGYSKEAIEAEIGLAGATEPAAPAAGAAPKFTGRTASDKSGNKLRETADGQWVP